MKILNVKYDNVTIEEALRSIFNLAFLPKKSNVFFLNIDCLCKAQKDKEYSEVLKNADLVLPDGIGLRLATALFGGKMRQNCNGTDLSPDIIRMAAEKNLRIFFFGAKEGVAQKAAEEMKKAIPGVVIAGALSGYIKDNQKTVRIINESKPDILFVAMGSPLQEKWIAGNRDKLDVKICIGVGAFLDYAAGNKPRAPAWMIKIHAEWLWRIFVEPARLLKRYIYDFFCLAIYLVWRRFRPKANENI